MSKLETEIRKEIRRYKNQLKDHLRSKSYTIMEELYNEAWKMYDSFITQYYEGYSPTSYIRHMDRGRGFSMGLYMGQNIQLLGSKKNPILRIEFLATEMMDDYQHDSALDVLRNVMSGYRGVPGYWIQPWDVSYYGKYFSYSGPSMIAAYDKFIEASEQILTEYFIEQLQEVL